VVYAGLRAKPVLDRSLPAEMSLELSFGVRSIDTMPLPPAHILVAAGAADLASATQPVPRWKVWLVGGAVGLLPDMDTGVGVLIGQSMAFHGIFTHTTVAVLAVALLTYLVAGWRWTAVTTAAYASHLLIDLLEDRSATSVQPWWPFSARKLDSVAAVFPSVPWERGDGPLGAALSVFDPQIFPALVAQTAVAAAVFVVCVVVSWLLRIPEREPRGRARQGADVPVG
jgi:membrane-bound metal-dependent hydrolase YbcI (DUF457 family)